MPHRKAWHSLHGDTPGDRELLSGLLLQGVHIEPSKTGWLFKTQLAFTLSTDLFAV
jgi:hypothetical protein